MGGGALYSTARDYIKFTQMILNKGRGNGNQVLKAKTVATKEPYSVNSHGQDDDCRAAVHKRRRSLSGAGEEVRPQLDDQHGEDR
ncbi:hypothetical protein AC629_26535 [Bradyrhizobium sp. NAS80.1]|nr:hypothetical protein AC629_26535 [Bradyrhizobium sp. NAS80.1]